MFQINSRCLLREVGAVVEVHHTTVWKFQRRKLKMFPYRVQIGQQLSDIDKANRVSYDRQCQKEMKENPSSLQQIFSLTSSVSRRRVI